MTASHLRLNMLGRHYQWDDQPAEMFLSGKFLRRLKEGFQRVNKGKSLYSRKSQKIKWLSPKGKPEWEVEFVKSPIGNDFKIPAKSQKII
ncbi:hypothetical protein GCM10027180_18190 [Microbulbifer echini]